MGEIKTKTMFDHIKHLTSVQDPLYWDKLDDASKKSWSSYMIMRFLSMNPDWISVLSDIQPYVQSLEPKQFYLCLIGIIPKGKYYLKYVKGKKEDLYEKWLVDLIVVDYQCSVIQAEDYLEILYSTPEGKTHIEYICKKYGTDPSKIKKLFK